MNKYFDAQFWPEKLQEASKVCAKAGLVGNLEDIDRQWGMIRSADSVGDVYVAAKMISAHAMRVVQKMLEEGRGMTELRGFAPFNTLVGMVPQAVDNEKAYNLTARVLYHAAAYDLHGQREYCVDPNLAELLLHTEVRGITGDMVQMPYEAIAITLPKHVQGLRVWNDETDWHRLEVAHVTLDRVREGHRYLHILVVGENKGGLEYEQYVEAGIEVANDAILYFALVLDDGKPITLDLGAWDGHAMPAGHVETTKTVGDWVVNVLQYITSSEARLEVHANSESAQALRDRMARERSPTKRDKLKQQLKGKDLRRLTRVGWGTSPMREHSRDGKPLTVRVLVAGHRKRVPHGPGRVDRKDVWIKPYWRGPELGDSSSAVHVVK